MITVIVVCGGGRGRGHGLASEDERGKIGAKCQLFRVQSLAVVVMGTVGDNSTAKQSPLKLETIKSALSEVIDSDSLTGLHRIECIGLGSNANALTNRCFAGFKREKESAINRMHHL